MAGLDERLLSGRKTADLNQTYGQVIFNVKAWITTRIIRLKRTQFLCQDTLRLFSWHPAAILPV